MYLSRVSARFLRADSIRARSESRGTGGNRARSWRRARGRRGLVSGRAVAGSEQGAGLDGPAAQGLGQRLGRLVRELLECIQVLGQARAAAGPALGASTLGLGRRGQ